MAFLETKDVRIVGLSVGVPKRTIKNEGTIVRSTDYDAAAFVATTGVYQRRVDPMLTTSDLCLPAAEQLISDLGWKKSEIDGLIFLTQSTDYILPATACILQNKLGLSKECYAVDVVLGCSGWVYGLSLAASLVSSGTIRKMLFLVGDARNLFESGPASDPLFGHAGAVTALEYVEGDDGFKFHFGTDGSGYDAIMIPDGGSRNQITPKSFEVEEIDGRFYNRLQLRMKGMDVFSFGISVAPKSIKKLIAQYDIDQESIDYYLFHQANMMINEAIRKKMKLPKEKVPYSMSNFGNTTSATIPLTMVTQLSDKLKSESLHCIGCGFGVGLSWGTVDFTTEKIVVSNLVEVE